MSFIEIDFPIFYFNKSVNYRLRDQPTFSIDEDGLVSFEDIEEYITNYDEHQ